MKQLGSTLALVVFALAGCPKEETGLTNAEARSAGDALAAGIEDSALGFGKVNEGSTAEPGCVALVGDTADPDADNIPNNAKLTYNCTGSLFGVTGTLSGQMGVVDDQPNAVAWAFTGMSDLDASLTGPDGGSIKRNWNGKLVASQASPAGPYKTQRTLDVTTVFKGARGGEVTVTEDNDWSVTFMPMVTWTPGSVIVTGKLDATGSWNITVGDHAATATLATPTALTLDPNCATRVTAGTITASYVDDAELSGTITVTWSGCGVKTVTRAN